MQNIRECNDHSEYKWSNAHEFKLETLLAAVKSNTFVAIIVYNRRQFSKSEIHGNLELYFRQQPH